MEVIKHKYQDNIIYKDIIFEYESYKDISDEHLIKLFNVKKDIISHRTSNGKLKGTLWDGQGLKWIKSKIDLYGVYISKPELFEIITPTGFNSPYSFYDIRLKIL